MTLTRSLLLLSAALTFGGCGGDLCERIAKDAEDCGETVSDEEVDQCRESLADCSGKDEKKLDEMFDCFQDAGLFECEDTGTSSTPTGTGFEDLGALIECGLIAQEVSSECQKSMGVFDTSTSSFTFTSTSTTY